MIFRLHALARNRVSVLKICHLLRGGLCGGGGHSAPGVEQLCSVQKYLFLGRGDQLTKVLPVVAPQLRLLSGKERKLRMGATARWRGELSNKLKHLFISKGRGNR